MPGEFRPEQMTGDRKPRLGAGRGTWARRRRASSRPGVAVVKVTPPSSRTTNEVPVARAKRRASVVTYPSPRITTRRSDRSARDHRRVRRCSPSPSDASRWPRSTRSRTPKPSRTATPAASGRMKVSAMAASPSVTSSSVKLPGGAGDMVDAGIGSCTSWCQAGGRWRCPRHLGCGCGCSAGHFFVAARFLGDRPS